MEENQQPCTQHTATTTLSTKYMALSHHKYRLLLVLTIAVLGMFFVEAYEILPQGRYTPTSDTYKLTLDSKKLLVNNVTEVRNPGNTSNNSTRECFQGCSVASQLPLPHEDTISHVQAARQAQLRDFCLRYAASMKEKGARAWNLLYSDRRGVVYCSVPKVACTNWKRVLQVLEGNMRHPLQIKNIHKLKYLNVNSLPPSERAWRRNVYYSLVFVRHP